MAAGYAVEQQGSRMQNIVFEKPYEFVPPYEGTIWIKLFTPFVNSYLKRNFGIVNVEFRDIQRLEQSLAKGHGILLAANHPRPCDPMVVGALSIAARQPIFTMAASWLFMQGGFQAWAVRRLGGFSVYREGLDRAAVNAAIDILATARRPLVIFAEGTVTRANDQVFDLMDGTAFIARQGAKRRAKNGDGDVVIHPVAIKYVFHGDVEESVGRVLTDIENWLTWRPQRHLPLIKRIYRVGRALLCLKEIEYLGRPQTGAIPDRVAGLIDHLLQPLESEWIGGNGEGNVIARVKRLRMAILPDMVAAEIPEEERVRRWSQLADVYLAQQLSCYPEDYVESNPVAERLLETVEKYEEDLTDKVRIHGPMAPIVQVGEPITVDPGRPPRGEADPLLQTVHTQLSSMLASLNDEIRSDSWQQN
ncbi:MAG: 1-acyl-sn-glycerol-3-phosphate acyltransferase [Pirellulales bacterium]